MNMNMNMNDQKVFVPDDFYCPITGELMNNPVSEPNGGHTYEKSAILRWLHNNSISPMTRLALKPDQLTDNKALKKSIDCIRDKLNEDQLSIKSKITDKENKIFTSALENVELNAYYNEKKLMVNIKMPDIINRPPVDVCLCIDVSGSMGAMATLKGDKGETIDYGISVLSLTVSAAKTIINSLSDNDNISIVTYTDKAKRLIENQSCSAENKKIIEEELDKLIPMNTTNIWDGLKNSLDILRETSPQNRMKGVFLLTDGIPNIEPSRGHEYMLEKYFKDHNFHCPIDCYGFGYSLKSELLDNMSCISGGNGFSFIPDASLLGNIFIHGMSNFLTTAIMHADLKIVLSENFKFTDGKTTKEISLKSLKYGQDKNIMFELNAPNTDNCDMVDFAEIMLFFNEFGLMKDVSDYDKPDIDYYYEQLYRNKTLDVIDKCINLKKFNDVSFKNLIDNLILDISFNEDVKNNTFIQNILFDLEGQIREALNMTSVGEKEDWFSKWGIHYLRSLNRAYTNELCNNFKDKGVSNFGGELFNTLRDEISDIFDEMPPPKRVANTYGGLNYGGSRGATRGGGTALPQLSTMASYNTSGGGCCAKGSRIRMEDNTFKKVEDLVKGDEVITVDVHNGIQHIESGFIECVIVTKCDENIEKMVTLKDLNNKILKITPYHPIIGFGLTSDWRFPIDVKKPELVECEEMYTFVISNRQSVLIEDYIFVTYGHNLQEDIVKHEYLGTDKVITDLKRNNNYQKGKIYLTKDMFKRDISGKIFSIGLNINYNRFIKKMYFANL